MNEKHKANKAAAAKRYAAKKVAIIAEYQAAYDNYKAITGDKWRKWLNTDMFDEEWWAALNAADLEDINKVARSLSVKHVAEQRDISRSQVRLMLLQ